MGFLVPEFIPFDTFARTRSACVAPEIASSFDET